MGKPMIGSARIDENGRAYGGAAGDQTGREVMTQAYYTHKLGWYVLRPKIAAQAEAIAADMEAMCANDKIGYDQLQRNSLYKISEPVGFDCAKVATACETDCSGGVRVCCAHAGIMTDVAFRTTNERAVLMATGAFELLTDVKYTAHPQGAYLKRGDILGTLTQGHTGVVLTNGDKAEATPTQTHTLGSRELAKGDKGADVTALQEALARLGHDPKGIDGDFDPNTEKAVKAFQRARGDLDVDGIYGRNTHAALMDALGGLDADDATEPTKNVTITAAGNWNVRKGPGTNYGVLSVVSKGATLPYVSKAENGWVQVEINGTTGWVAGKCAEVK